jgi:hypothetical protein
MSHELWVDTAQGSEGPKVEQLAVPEGQRRALVGAAKDRADNPVVHSRSGGRQSGPPPFGGYCVLQVGKRRSAGDRVERAGHFRLLM